MTSHRHNYEPDPVVEEVAQRPSRDPGTQNAYLDAARECILDVGWRRTTLTEVARRAGVSRMTIYRAWSDMPALLGDLMTREWTGLVAGQVDLAGEPTPVRVADAVAATVEALRDNELFTRIVELDPELILPYLLARRGRSQELIIGVLAGAVTEGQRRGTIRDGDPVAIARGLVLAAHGFVLSAHTMLDEAVDATALDAELHTLIVRSLTP
ncbi:TetR family transcriptional regulator [Nocardioides aromaticivorans]|uniref:TetR family transcriptional regulator n=1 Tax=Nocardioides aromaticivorans TaxID=200618 RepID=A0ABX7PS60_9ACTN|nr:TetR/AcrR family transcriptional regulator [Nocardioides aromaticivorans]QSR28603.1 TetR family transcriptional regulator [Nocardioides aromaticivorans]